jgi:signal transduction histidine kinase
MAFKYRARLIPLTVFFLLVSCKETDKKTGTKQSIYFFIDNAITKTPTTSSGVDSAYYYIVSSPDNAKKLDYLFKLGNIYYNRNDLEKFKVTSEKSIAVALKLKDTAATAKALRYKAEYYNSEQIFDSSFKYYRASERLYQSIGDSENLARTLYKKSLIQFYEHDYLGADLSLTEANSYLKASINLKLKYQILSMIGIVSNEIGDYEKAIEFHKKALDAIAGSNMPMPENQESSTLNNIGIVYQNLSNHKEAIKNFNAALANNNLKSGMPDLYARLLDNKGYSELQLKSFDNLPGLFLKSLEIRDSLKMVPDQISSKIHLSEYYDVMKDTVNAKKYANEAFVSALEINSPIDRLISLKQLLAVDKVRASKLSVKYTNLNDSLQQVERKSRDKFSRLQFETKEITQANDKLEEQNRTLLYFFIATMLIGVLLFVIRNQRAKNRELLLIQSQQKANEDIYNLMINQQNVIEESRVKEKKRIAQELHDGVLGRLFGARLNLDSLNRIESSDAILKRNQYLAELKNIEQDIREISHDLNREKYLLVNNFTAILTNLLEEQQSSFASDMHYIIDPEILWDEISNNMKINLYRIIQESLQNVNKYANAKNVHVIIKKLGDREIILKVIDDGDGFDTSIKKKGIGLQNMNLRTQELGGTINILSQKGKGTEINLVIPINEKVF